MVLVLKTPETVVSVLAFVEHHLNKVITILGALISSQILLTSYLWHFTPMEARIWLAVETLLFLWLWLRLLRRQSLQWQATELLNSLRESPSVDLTRLGIEIVSFRAAKSMLAIWFGLSLLANPLYEHYLDSSQFTFWTRIYAGWDDGFISNMWQVQATILGVFLALLAIIFQMISIKVAYESSLLPFLVRRIRFPEIIVANFVCLTLDALALRWHSAQEIPVEWKYAVIVGFLFSVISAIFLTYRTLDLLGPEAIQRGLSEMIRADISTQLEEEQREALAGHVLTERCIKNELEFSVWDFHNQIPAIRADSMGEIIDIDLRRLDLFARAISEPVPLNSPPRRKAILVAGIGHRMEPGRTVLARVHAAETTLKKRRLLNRCFRLSG